ncbi:MAG: HIT family protein [Haloferacaceae archaeon]
MSTDCVFCRIVAGTASARFVRETETTIAFLDANPLAPGHTLVIPKGHHERIADLDRELATDVFGEVHELVPRIERAVDADGVTVGVNDGDAAGQEVPHVHVHLVPRFEDDDGGPIHRVAGSRPSVSREEMASIAERISRSG